MEHFNISGADYISLCGDNSVIDLQIYQKCSAALADSQRLQSYKLFFQMVVKAIDSYSDHPVSDFVGLVVWTFQFSNIYDFQVKTKIY